MATEPWFFDKLAPNVRLAGTIINDTLHGPDAVKAQISAVVANYTDMTFKYQHDFADRRVEEYTATVAGRPISGLGSFHYDEHGLIDEIVVNHRPLAAALTLSRLVGETELGKAAPNRFYRLDGQSYADLTAYADAHAEQL
jgi:hypothetical protein